MEDNGLLEKIPTNWWTRQEERTRFILKELKEIKEHVQYTNSKVSDNTIRSIQNQTWVNIQKWILGFVSAIMVASLATMWTITTSNRAELHWVELGIVVIVSVGICATIYLLLENKKRKKQL